MSATSSSARSSARPASSASATPRLANSRPRWRPTSRDAFRTLRRRCSGTRCAAWCRSLAARSFLPIKRSASRSRRSPPAMPSSRSSIASRRTDRRRPVWRAPRTPASWPALRAAHAAGRHGCASAEPRSGPGNLLRAPARVACCGGSLAPHGSRRPGHRGSCFARPATPTQAPDAPRARRRAPTTCPPRRRRRPRRSRARLPARAAAAFSISPRPRAAPTAASAARLPLRQRAALGRLVCRRSPHGLAHAGLSHADRCRHPLDPGRQRGRRASFADEGRRGRAASRAGPELRLVTKSALIGTRTIEGPAPRLEIDVAELKISAGPDRGLTIPLGTSSLLIGSGSDLRCRAA